MVHTLPRALTWMVLSSLSRNTLLQLSLVNKNYAQIIDEHFQLWARSLIKHDTFFALLPEEEVVRYLKRAQLRVIDRDDAIRSFHLTLNYTYWCSLARFCSDVPKFIASVNTVHTVGQRNLLSTAVPLSIDIVQVERFQNYTTCLTQEGQLLVSSKGPKAEGIRNVLKEIQHDRYSKIHTNCGLSATGKFVEFIEDEEDLPAWKELRDTFPLMLDFDRSEMDPEDPEVDTCYNFSYITLDGQAWNLSTDHPEPRKIVDQARKIFCIEHVTFVLTLDQKWYYFDPLLEENRLLLEGAIDAWVKECDRRLVSLHVITKECRMIYSYENCELVVNTAPRLGDKLWIDFDHSVVIEY